MGDRNDKWRFFVALKSENGDVKPVKMIFYDRFGWKFEKRSICAKIETFRRENLKTAVNADRI